MKGKENDEEGGKDRKLQSLLKGERGMTVSRDLFS
jgi:hypothetical protein